MKEFCKGWLVLTAVGALCCFFAGCGGAVDETSDAARSPSEPAAATKTPDQADKTAQEKPTDPDQSLTPSQPTAQELAAATETASDTEPSLKPNQLAAPTMRSFTRPMAIQQPTADDPAPDSASNPPALTTTQRVADGPKEVEVFYGTDRNRQLASASQPSRIGLLASGLLFAIAAGFLVFNRLKSGFVIGAFATVLMAALFFIPGSQPTGKGYSYGTQRGEFVRGVATVTVPASHIRGMVERPSILRLEFSEDKNKHIVLAKAEELDSDEFYKRMTSSLEKTDEQDLLVFIHGYNVDFDSAIRRTAQIATDLAIQGVPVCYSWPSQGSLVGYTVDENNVVWTVPHLRDFLLELAEKSHAKSINIISHSMGNRAMAEAVSQISRQLPGDGEPIFDQVVLAAPDVDADHFRNELAPLLANAARHVTLYASSDDQALIASKHLHGGYARAGESGENLVVIRGVETIDVSGIDLSLLGHSYYGDSESILRDLLSVVRDRMPANQRTWLTLKLLNNTPYWAISPPQVSELNDQQTTKRASTPFAPGP